MERDGEGGERREEKEGGWERRMDNNEGEGWQMCGEEGGWESERRGSGGGKREGGRVRREREWRWEEGGWESEGREGVEVERGRVGEEEGLRRCYSVG